MSRETIRVSNYLNEDFPNVDEWEDKLFSLVQREQVGYDSEKGYVEYECIIRRVSDDTYFKLTYTQFGHHGNDLLEQVATEVTPKTKTITYYE